MDLGPGWEMQADVERRRYEEEEFQHDPQWLAEMKRLIREGKIDEALAL